MLPTEPALNLEPTDLLSRFATQSNHYNTYGITPKAFMPNTKNMQLSVFCTTGLTVEEITNVARDNIPGKVYGHGLSFVAFIRGLGLSIDYDNEPEKHANVIGWPENKDGQKNLAQKLSREVNSSEAFCRYPEPIEPLNP